MYTLTKFKRKVTDEGEIEISEFIKRYEGSLLCDPQSGARLVFTPRYLVIFRDKDGFGRFVGELNFEQVHDKYPWFFDEF